MTVVDFPYGTSHLKLDIPSSRLQAVLLSKVHGFRRRAPESELVLQALESPIGSPRLAELVKDRPNVVYLASDHTRPVPTKVIFPPVVEEIRRANPKATITVLISTGSHRGSTKAELEAKFGPGTLAGHRTEIHDCDASDMVKVGTLPSGGDFSVNRLAVEADLLIAEGFIEPHFFAGFSGGRKSVFPGVTDRAGVMYNHCSAFIDHQRSRTGILEGNPIHRDMIHAAKAVNLAFIVNVVLDSDKKVIAAFAGHFDQAHLAGVDFLSGLCGVPSTPADIVVAANGGYPLDQNIYQAVKGMTAAEANLKPGGVLIMAARCEDGHGAEGFYQTFKAEKDLRRMMEAFLARDKGQTVPDQWQSQILARILLKHQVVMVTEAPRQMVEEFQFKWAPDLRAALETADALIGHDRGSITAIPDGVGVIVT